MSERLQRPDWTKNTDDEGNKAAILAKKADRKDRVRLARTPNSISPTITGVNPTEPAKKTVIPLHRRDK